MARTTMAIDDDLLRELKQRAAREGRSFQALANDLLRMGLAGRYADREPYRLALRGWRAEPQPGVDLLDRASLYDLMDEPHE